MIQTTPSGQYAKQGLLNYKNEAGQEWQSILQYWMDNTIDKNHGGFYGAIDNENIPKANAAKGLVMYSRILWSFSTAYLFYKNEKYLQTAQRAYNYILSYFTDKENGGMYWSVDEKGEMLDGKKQIYALAFCIYGMSEFYKCTKDKVALQTAIELFNLIEKYSYDEKYQGYLEAFTNDWQLIEDMRLSEKDANEKKTMNTHLHIVEGYANLYSIWPDEKLKGQIKMLLNVFDKHMINPQTGHLILFLNEAWETDDAIVSFGHDVEAAWLLLESAEIINDKNWIERYKELSLKLANASLEGVDKDGAMFYEYEVKTNHWIKEKHWWVQAEAMVGFLNAYQLTGNENYLQHSINSWEFCKKHIINTEHGEWFWGVNNDYSLMQNQDKAGFWKCPYHNSRACMEIVKRIQ